MKSKRLTLDQLAVKSFITEMPEKKEQTVKGGFETIVDTNCTLELACRDTVVPRKCPSMLCPC